MPAVATMHRPVSPLIYVLCGVVVLALLRVWPMVWRQWRSGYRFNWRRNDYSAARRMTIERLAGPSAAALTFAVVAILIRAVFGAGRGAVLATAVPLVLCVASLALLFSVRLLDRPRWAVPPVLREPGLADPSLKAFVVRYRPALGRLALVRRTVERRRWIAQHFRSRGNSLRAGRTYGRQAARLRDCRRELDQITPPPQLAETYGKLLSALELLSGGWQAIGSAARDESHDELLAAVRAAAGPTRDLDRALQGIDLQLREAARAGGGPAVTSRARVA